MQYNFVLFFLRLFLSEPENKVDLSQVIDPIFLKKAQTTHHHDDPWGDDVKDKSFSEMDNSDVFDGDWLDIAKNYGSASQQKVWDSFTDKKKEHGKRKVYHQKKNAVKSNK